VGNDLHARIIHACVTFGITQRTKVQLYIFALITLMGCTFVGARYARLDRIFFDDSYTVVAHFQDSGGIFDGAIVSTDGDLLVGMTARISPGTAMTRKVRWLLAIGVLALVGIAGAATAVARMDPSLSASGPGKVTGTEASAIFELGDKTYHQVRYGDRKTLTYSFTLHNDGAFDTTVTGLEPVEHVVTVRLPEELRTGSAREMFCPRANASTRPPG